MIDQLTDAFANEFHRLDRALFQKSEPSGSKALQFTSAHPGEGVTSLVLAFGTFLARLHGPSEIIVIEANLRDPFFSNYFALPDSKGLVDLLKNPNQYDEIITKAPDSGISLITAGNPKGDAECNAIESCLENIGIVLTELRKKYRFILIDSPAILPYIDATVIAGYTDGVILVVEANATRSEVLDEATERLKTSGAEVLGAILNKREFHIPKWLYRLV